MASAPCGRGASGHPSALGRDAGEPRVPHVAPQLPVWGGAQGPGPSGVVGWFRGRRTRWTPVTAVTSCVCRKMCTPSRAAGAGGGGGVQALPQIGGWG